MPSSTPNSELLLGVRKVLEEEGKQLGVTIKAVERAGVSVKQHLVRTDMSGGVPCPQGDCVLCITGSGEPGGLKHHRSGALYTGACSICPAEQGPGFTAVYTGESGDSGYARTKQHKESIERRNLDNAFAKHLHEHHPNRAGDFRAFQFKVARTFQRSLVRQIWEAVAIHGCRATFILNSRAEWEQPVVDRVVIQRELPELPEVMPAGGGGGRGRGRGGAARGGGGRGGGRRNRGERE